MTPIYCYECGRANSVKAKRCIWCGVPIVDASGPASFEPTRVEIGYLDGIERLDNPTPIILLIDSGGVEVREVMPGTRSSRIPAEAIISATVVDGSTMVEAVRDRPRLWQLLLRPMSSSAARRTQVKKHDYILNIKYREGDYVQNAVFHREDRAGLSVVEGLARIISMLVRLQDRG
jgi:hypothetical protein